MQIGPRQTPFLAIYFFMLASVQVLSCHVQLSDIMKSHFYPCLSHDNVYDEWNLLFLQFVNAKKTCTAGENFQLSHWLAITIKKFFDCILRKKQFLFPKFDDYIKQIKESKVQSQDKDQTVITLGAFTN